METLAMLFGGQCGVCSSGLAHNKIPRLYVQRQGLPSPWFKPVEGLEATS